MKLLALALAAVCLYGQAVTVKVPVRDGVLLATDVYGADPRQPKPVLLTRTPYDKSGAAKIAAEYARQGYTVVVQDCRGRYASGGAYTPYNEDRQDGFDTVEWINRQPWSNGRVGMFGGSHLGLVQWLAMAEKAPGLVTIAPAFTASSLYRVAYRDGVLRMALISSAGTRAHPPADGRKLPAEIGMLHYHLPLMHLPLARLEEAYGWSLPWMSALLSHPAYSSFWRQTSAEHDIASSDLPVQIVTGYFDFFHHEAVQDFFRLRGRKSKAPVQLILGPWTHGGSNRSRTQEMDFGPAAVMNVQAVNLAWFDWHLKRKPTPHPLVRYFSMGENQWHEADSWPPSSATIGRLYLGPKRKASFAAATNLEQPAIFTSDPANPVPSAPPDRRDIDRSALWSPDRLHCHLHQIRRRVVDHRTVGEACPLCRTDQSGAARGSRHTRRRLGGALVCSPAQRSCRTARARHRTRLIPRLARAPCATRSGPQVHTHCRPRKFRGVSRNRLPFEG